MSIIVRVRQPGEDWSSRTGGYFGSAREADDFIKEIAPSYPDGTFIYASSDSGEGGGGTISRHSFIVKDSEAVKTDYLSARNNKDWQERSKEYRKLGEEVESKVLGYMGEKEDTGPFFPKFGITRGHHSRRNIERLKNLLSNEQALKGMATRRRVDRDYNNLKDVLDHLPKSQRKGIPDLDWGLPYMSKKAILERDSSGELDSIKKEALVHKEVDDEIARLSNHMRSRVKLKGVPEGLDEVFRSPGWMDWSIEEKRKELKRLLESYGSKYNLVEKAGTLSEKFPYEDWDLLKVLEGTEGMGEEQVDALLELLRDQED